MTAVAPITDVGHPNEPLCPMCRSAPLETDDEWGDDEVAGSIVTWHYCPRCGWDDRDGQDER